MSISVDDLHRHWGVSYGAMRICFGWSAFAHMREWRMDGWLAVSLLRLSGASRCSTISSLERYYYCTAAICENLTGENSPVKTRRPSAGRCYHKLTSLCWSFNVGKRAARFGLWDQCWNRKLEWINSRSAYSEKMGSNIWKVNHRYHQH